MERWIRMGAAVLVAVAVAAAALVYRDASGLVGSTHPGFSVLPSGTVGPRATTPRPEVLDAHDLRPRDRVTHADGVPLPGGRAVLEAVRARPSGARITYRVERPRGGTLERTVPASALRQREVDRTILPLLVGGLLTVLVGSIGVLARPDVSGARVLFLYCWSMGLNALILSPDFSLTYRFVPWSFVTPALAKASLLHLALTFPQPRGPLRGAGRRGFLLALYGLLLLQNAIYPFLFARAPGWIEVFDEVAYATFAFGFFAFAANVLASARNAPDEKVRQQARVALAGPALVLFAASGLSVAAWLRPGTPTPLLFAAGMSLVFVLSLTYALLRHNLFELDAVLRRGLSAGVVLLAGAVLYLALFVGLQGWVGERAAWVSMTLALGLVALGIPAFTPLRRWVERAAGEALFPDLRAAREMVDDAGPRLARVRDSRGAAQALADLAREGLHAGEVAVLVPRPGGTLEDPRTPGEVRGDAALLAGLGSAHARLEQHGTRLLAPFPAAGSGEDAPGALALGPRSDGRLYTTEDLAHVEALAAHGATALANAAAWEGVRELEERLAQENAWLREEIELEHGFDELVGASPGLKRALAQVEQVAPTDATVLVEGETGSGKELLVRALHELSPRRDRELVKIACAAIPETLLESELFGYEQGAFTSAERAKAGRFEAADGGTVFFDDVDTLPLGIQAKLLRALQEGEVQRLGSSEVRRVDVRVIAATNRDLFGEVRAGRFREDLYYRLHVVPIDVPPLRERRDDIVLLARHFVEVESRKLGREPHPLSPQAEAALQAYEWPGNVRELRNVIERAVVLSRGAPLELPEALGAASAGAGDEAVGAESGTLADQVRDFKSRLIRAALEESGGNQREAAERLGLHRQSLTRMIRDLALKSEP